uniref:Glycine rich superfamily member n=1 Tax=Rhipicephalus appendiculatus TaxID=34631 RepID=A0A131Z4H5_RHIAP
MFSNSVVSIMLSTEVIPTYLTVFFLIPGAFPQNELFSQSEAYCRRFIPLMISSDLGLCTYPCLLLSVDQPPKVLVLSEPDGTACKVFNGFQQTPQVGNCRGGFCQETRFYDITKRVKRDVSASVTPNQQNSSVVQKQLSTRRGSKNPKTSRRERIELRRRQMWSRCDCASMRGLFIDMSYSLSGLGIGRSGKRGRRRKVGCRVICFFLINKYKHDRNWASLFEARFSTAGSGKFENATGIYSGQNRGDHSISSNRTDATTSTVTATIRNPQSPGARVNGSGLIGSGRTELTNNLASRSGAPGALNGATGINAGGATAGGYNTSAGTTGSGNVGSAIINKIGTSAVLPVTGNVGSGGTSNATTDNKLSNSVEAASPGSGGANVSPATVPGVTVHPGMAETAVTLGKPVGAVSTGGIIGSGSSPAGSAHIGSSTNGTVISTPSTTGTGGISTNGIRGPGALNNGSGSGLSSISAGGSGSGAEIGLESGTAPSNVVVSNARLREQPSVHNVESVPGTRHVTSSGTGRADSNPVGDETPVSGVPGAVAGGLPRQTNSRSPTNTVAGAPQTGSGLSTATTSSESALGTSPLEGGTNVTSSNVPAVSGSSGTVITATGGNAGSSTPSGAHASSRGGVSGSTASVSSGGGSSSGEGPLNGVTSNGGVISGTVPENNVSSAHPSGTRIGPSFSSGGARVGGTSESTRGAGLPGASSTPTNINPVVTAGSNKHSSGTGSGGAGVGAASESTAGAGLPGATPTPTNVNPVVTAASNEHSSGTGGTGNTGNEGTGGASSGDATRTISPSLPNGSSDNLNNVPGAASGGSTIGLGASYGTVFGSTTGYGAGTFPGNNMPENVGGAYGNGASGFGNAGSGMSSGPWGPPGGVFNGMGAVGAGYGNTGYPGNFANMPGAQPFGRVGGFGSNRRFPSDVGIYDDDIFFQE